MSFRGDYPVVSGVLLFLLPEARRTFQELGILYEKRVSSRKFKHCHVSTEGSVFSTEELLLI